MKATTIASTEITAPLNAEARSSINAIPLIAAVAAQAADSVVASSAQRQKRRQKIR